MYPRLKIARELLKEDGVIFISIDDNEQANLKIMCDEIFGEENFISNIIWQKKYTRSNDAKWFSDNHDHILCYGKNKSTVVLNQVARSLEQMSAYTNPDNHPRGPWKSTPLHAKSGSNTSSYTFKNEIEWTPPLGTYRRYSNESLGEFEKNNEIWFGINGESIPSRKSFLNNVKQGVTPVTIWLYNEVGHNHEANEELKNISLDGTFSSPKPSRLIHRCLSLAISDSDTILDFFAGSGTTGDAVMQLNAEDGGKRKYILAQLDEQIDESKEAYNFCKENGFEPVISSITIERLNRAGEKIKVDTQVEFDTENSKKKPSKEKLTELREKYIRVFGNEPRDPRVKHEDDLLSTVIPDSDPESPIRSEEMLNQVQHDSNPLDIGYKVFSLKDKPCIKEVVKDGGQVEFVPQNLRKATIDTLANMLCATCKPLHTKIETLIADKLYKADNEIYLLAPVDKAELDKYKDLKINVDGYSDLDLEHFLNLGVADKDVSVVY